MLRRLLPIPLLAALALALAPAPSQASLPPGFYTQTVIDGLIFPSTVRFAPNGHIFVAEKHGDITEYNSPSDTTPTPVIDLAPEVYNFWDRGLLGLAVDPSFGSADHNHDFIYALYTRNAWPVGATPPTFQQNSSVD